MKGGRVLRNSVNPAYNSIGLKKSLITEMRKSKEAYAFILIPLILLLVFSIGPMVYGLVMSFTEWNGIEPATFIGLGNYESIFKNPDFYQALVNTVKFASLSLFMGVSGALVLALAIDKISRLQNFFKAAYFIPVITPMVVVALIWTLIFTDKGLLNYFISMLGFESVGWLTDKKIAMYSIVVTSAWQGLGFSMIIFLAGLQKIPEELYEAAKIDGAGSWQSFLHITLPGLKNTFVFLSVYGLIGAFQVFDQVYVMTKGGPSKSTQTLVYQIFENFRYLKLGYTSALSFVFLGILLVITIVQFKLFYKKDGS